MTIFDLSVDSLDGTPLDLSRFRGRALLVVNVASECGLTPQYEGLEGLSVRYRDLGLTVIGVPCNQFGEQEPGSAEQIGKFCSQTYDISFPLTEKLDVNGPRRHPLYRELTCKEDSAGSAGDVEWNFEKFLVGRDGEVLARFRPTTLPQSDVVVAAIEEALASTAPEHWTTKMAADVEFGDRLRMSSGKELRVTRITEGFLGVADLVCFVEDSEYQWLAQALWLTSEVEVCSPRGAQTMPPVPSS